MKALQEKFELKKESNINDIVFALSKAAREGYLDARKGLKARGEATILESLASKIMARHKTALLEAYKMGFDQGKNFVENEKE